MFKKPDAPHYRFYAQLSTQLVTDFELVEAIDDSRRGPIALLPVSGESKLFFDALPEIKFHSIPTCPTII